MITKCYLTEFAYSSEISFALDAFIHDRAKVPVVFNGFVIGHASGVRWWRRSSFRENEIPEERAVLCFVVKHGLSPQKRVGDFCGSNHSITLNFSAGKIATAFVTEIR